MTHFCASVKRRCVVCNTPKLVLGGSVGKNRKFTCKGCLEAKENQNGK